MSFVTRTYYVHFRFQVRAVYSERGLESLLEVLERRGADYAHLGDGRYEIQIPPTLSWHPFYKTLQECNDIHQVGWVHPKCGQANCGVHGTSE
jgi:hypothetical protein